MSEDLKVRVKPVNPIEIKGAIAFSAEHARIWAEGTDSEVEQLGGEHSAKGWADAVGEEGLEYTDQQIALAKTEMAGQIATASQGAVSTAKSYTDNQVALESAARQNADNNLQGNIDSEEYARISADNNLQGQIDSLAASSDVTDIVGTYAELQSYDTSKLKDNDIIKVLDDSTHDDAPSYYRWDKETETFSYIGSESASYTKAQADAKFLTQTDAASTYLTQSNAASTYATQTALAGKASNADGSTIVDNGTTITTVGVKEQNASAVIKKWVGTKAAYDAIETKDANTEYVTTDENDGQAIVIDNVLSSSSENPVQNKVIKSALDTKQAMLPAGTTGNFLQKTVNGVQWAEVDALPSQTGQSGKYLTTDGTSASWATVQGGGGAAADGTTIIDVSDVLSAVAIKEQRANTAIKQWVGTTAQYNAISTKDANTLYVITDGPVAQTVSNLVTSVSSSSTDAQYPSAKLFYDTCGDIETLINAL